MQYLLTQEEYDALKANKKKEDTEYKKELQKICTKVANEMPIFWDFGTSPDFAPWGCIIGREDWFCDKCPVQSICPKEWKSYSQ